MAIHIGESDAGGGDVGADDAVTAYREGTDEITITVAIADDGEVFSVYVVEVILRSGQGVDGHIGIYLYGAGRLSGMHEEPVKSTKVAHPKAIKRRDAHTKITLEDMDSTLDSTPVNWI